jgi:hypothetical protein
MPRRWLVAVLLVGAAAFVSGQQALAPPPSPSSPAAFGTTAANASETVELSQLTVAAVESGSSGQPQLVRQAFLASVNATTSAAGGLQTVSMHKPPRFVLTEGLFVACGYGGDARCAACL